MKKTSAPQGLHVKGYRDPALQPDTKAPIMALERLHELNVSALDYHGIFNRFSRFRYDADRISEFEKTALC